MSIPWTVKFQVPILASIAEIGILLRIMALLLLEKPIICSYPTLDGRFRLVSAAYAYY